MSTISKIATQQHQKDRFSIFLDGVYAFSLTGNELITAGLHTGQTLSAHELARVERLASEAAAYEKALSFISLRARSVSELRSYLEYRHHESVEVTEAVILKLSEVSLLDDLQFCRLWISDRANLKPSSKRRLSAELRTKGVQSEIIEQALAEIAGNGELDAAIAIAQKKLNRYPDQRKLLQYLCGQGFAYETAKKALEAVGA
ncbi:MAG: RecX family transcriptional regulator [Candidatus Saccharimonadia bacterium]